MSEQPTVGEMMSRDVAVLRANDALTIADDVMKLGRIRHMPVVEDDDETVLVGIVSQRDLFRGALSRLLGYGEHAQSKLMATAVVKEAMSTRVLTAHEAMPASEAAQRMLENKVGCLVVMEEDRLVGIVTEADFVKLALE